MHEILLFSLRSLLVGIVPPICCAVIAGAVPQAGGAVSPGDIVETNINYQPVTGEVLRSYGSTADLNLGQNNVGRYLEVQYMKVVQKAGTGGTSQFAPGDSVKRSNGSIVVTGKIMNTNGAYCEIDSSGSGFTGWSKCAQLRLVAKAPARPGKLGSGRAVGGPYHRAWFSVASKRAQSGRQSRFLPVERPGGNGVCQGQFQVAAGNQYCYRHERCLREEDAGLSDGFRFHRRRQRHRRKNG